MKVAWSFHKLANLLDSEGNIRPSNSQIVQAPYQLSEHSGISKKITLLTSIFHIDLHRIIHRRRILKTSQANQILGIFVLIQEYTWRICVYFQTQKLRKKTKVFHMKKTWRFCLRWVIKLESVPVMTISSTYTSKRTRLVGVLHKNKEESYWLLNKWEVKQSRPEFFKLRPGSLF
jgi:hypothetical protein